MKRGFDLLASSYDRLSSWVFGDAIKKAQSIYISEIGDNDRVLILGGGTGWILNAMFERKPTTQITFVDLSEAMIANARNTVKSDYVQQVTFIKGTYEDILAGDNYNIVFTAFYLDMFKQNEVERIVERVSRKIKNNGSWLFTDFITTNKMRQQLLMKIMYVFFKVTCGISANKLANFEDVFDGVGLKKREVKYFYNGMIESRIYTKQ